MRAHAPEVIPHQEGIVSLWRVSGRKDIRDFEEGIRLDIRCVDPWTFWLDLKILMKTFWVLLVRNGAF